MHPFRIKHLSRLHVTSSKILAFSLMLICSSCVPTAPTNVPADTHPAATEPYTPPPITVTASPVPTAFPNEPSSFYAFPLEDGEIIALINARVIDGTGAPAYRDWTVLIQGNRILDAGMNIEIPVDARVVDLMGKTILPGMFDMHGHLYSYDGEKLALEDIAYPRLYLAGGVTTVFTAGDFDPDGTADLKTRIANGEAVGPDILMTGPYFSGGNAPAWMMKASTPEGLLGTYDAWKDKIAGVKVYTKIPEDQFVALLGAAHSDGLFVTGHLESISAMRALELGIDGIEHGLFSMSEFFPKGASLKQQYCAISQLDMTSPELNAIVEEIVRQGTYIDPTIVVFQPELPDFVPLIEDWEKYLDPADVIPFRSWLRSIIEPVCLQKALDKQAQFIKIVHDRGGLIVAGTDPVIPILLPGYSLHRELQNLVAAGLSPLDAIKAATLNAAIVTRLDSQKGTITAGKIADLVVVDGNPDEDIKAIGNTVLIFRNGIPYLPEKLRQSVEGQIGNDK